MRRPAAPPAKTACRRAARRRALLACALAGWLALHPAGAQPTAPEANVKAAFVFNFLRFTEWPAAHLPARDAPLTLCVAATPARLAEALKALGGRSVDGRPLRVAEIERPDDLTRCHAAFVGEAARGVTAAWAGKGEALGVLMVGDAEGFASAGGMIGLVTDGPRMRFEINHNAVKRAGLKLDAQLLQLGRPVGEETPR